MYSDNALSSKEEDELGRYKFAEQIADGIVKSTSKKSECLVIGITGAWGTGKSTLVNFVINEIERIHTENQNLFSPVILRFNPWMFSGQRELQLIFLKELYTRFRKFDTTLEKASEKLQTFLGKLHFLKYVHSGADELLKDTSKFFEGLNSESSLEELKKEIDQILIETETRIYITIDDIDRLTPSEVAEILQLVKLNGNFSNTTFILSYDDQVVQNSMETVFGNFGRNYLEKIVQVDYSVPLLSRERKEIILKKRLKETFSKSKLKSKDDMVDEIQNQPYFELLKSIRDINRLLNSVQLRLPLMETEVYIPDFVLIEAIRSFCPKGFKFMYASKAKLFESSLSKSRLGIDFIKEKTKLAEFINSAHIEESAKIILTDLFVPEGNHQIQAEFANEKFITSRRVTHKYYFDRYFSLEIGEKEISEKLFFDFEKPSKIHRHRILKEVIEKDQLILFLKWLILKVDFNDKQKSILFSHVFSYSEKVKFHDHQLFATNHDFWFLLQFTSQLIEKIRSINDRRTAILNFLDEERKDSKFYILPLCNDIFSAQEKFKEGKLYSNERWSGLFSKEDDGNLKFVEKIKEHFIYELKRNLKRLSNSFEKFSNADEVNFIIVNSQHYIPELYEKALVKITSVNDHLLDLITICIGKKSVSSSGKGSGFCLERGGLYEGMDIDDVYERIKSISIENFEGFDQNRLKSAKFYLKVYEDDFLVDTYYSYDSLKIVSRP